MILITCFIGGVVLLTILIAVISSVCGAVAAITANEDAEI
jgi:hypothetical protein